MTFLSKEGAMKAKEIYYEKKFNLGNYETETIGLLVVVEEGEKFSDVLQLARKAVLAAGTKVDRPGSAKELTQLIASK
jgi:hypothetical protein